MTLITQDTLLNGRVRLSQPAKGFRVGIDTVLLAAAVPAMSGGAIVLDAGCGVGGALLCLAMRCPAYQMIGIDIQPDYAALARENIHQHGLDSRITIHDGAVEDKSILAAHSIDHVMMNPPYFAPDSTPAPCVGRDIANRQQGDLGAWFRTVRRVTRPGGTVSLIYPASGIADIMAWMASGMGGVTIMPIHARADLPAMRILVQAKIASKAPAAILPGLVIHRDDGAYTDAAHAILRDMAAIDIKA